MDVSALVEQLREVDRRYAPPGEASGAAYAKLLAEWRLKEVDREEVCNTGDATTAWLLLWLCARYGIRPFRRPRQKPTTICIRAPKGFVATHIGPQLQEMAAVFEHARAAGVDELVTAWLGPAAVAEPIIVDVEAAPAR